MRDEWTYGLQLGLITGALAAQTDEERKAAKWDE